MDIVDILSKLFGQAHNLGLSGVFQFVFSAQQRFWVEIVEPLTVNSGHRPDADTTIDVSEQNFIGIMLGKADIEQLFASGQIRISGNMGLATMLPQLIAGAGRNRAEKAQVPADGRYPAPERHADRVSRAQPQVRAIERIPRQHLSEDLFNRHYLPQGIPVIISDALQDWPLFTMGRERSMAHFSELQGITRHGDYVKKTFSTDRDFRSTSMADFITSLDEPAAGKDGEPPAYMGNNIVPTQLLALIRLPSYFDASLFIAPRIWIGPKGTLTPMHRDDTDNLFAQVWGQKSFILAAPHHREDLGTWSTSREGGLEGCDFNPDAPDFERFPQARDVTFLRVILEAGDLLFLPDGWFHQVESVSTSLSVNFWVNSSRR